MQLEEADGSGDGRRNLEEADGSEDEGRRPAAAKTKVCREKIKLGTRVHHACEWKEAEG